MISVKIIADSYNVEFDSRVTTFELIYPRFIHSELMTHRVFSRNAASSRAIPIKKMIELVEKDPAMPLYWGANQAGMQAASEIDNKELAKSLWLEAAASAVHHATALDSIGLHKQIVNRVIEPFQNIKTIVTSTNFENFFYLRAHSDAQPEIKKLAEMMLQQFNKSKFRKLKKDEWHVPYVDTKRINGKLSYFDEKGKKVSVNTAKKISASCCAQVSYRVNDKSIEKADNIFKRLIVSEPIHASPIEHQCTPLINDYKYDTQALDKKGITHLDKYGMPWSGNFHGWVQFRQLIKNNAKRY